MRKERLISALAALLCAVLLIPSAVAGCAHYPGIVADEELVTVGRTEPQQGVPGSTGDRVCPLCGAVIVPAREIDPLPEPAEHPAADDTEAEGQPDPAAAPQETGPAESDPEPAVIPEPPAGGAEDPGRDETVPAEQPAEILPSGSGKAAEQELPVTDPAGGGENAPVPAEQPAAPVPETPAGNAGITPEAVTEPPAKEAPSAPAKTPAPEADPVPEAGGEKADRAPAAEEAARTAVPAGAADAGGGGGKASSGTAAAGAYPFRRTRFSPEPGIWAEAAGERVWPAYATPFLQMNRP